MAAPLHSWVSDHLMRIIGLSDKRTVEYLIGVSTKASSCDALLATLRESDALPLSDANVGTFVKELWERVPRRPPSVPSTSKGTHEKVMPLSYKWVKSDSDNEDQADMEKASYICSYIHLHVHLSRRKHDCAF